MTKCNSCQNQWCKWIGQLSLLLQHRRCNFSLCSLTLYLFSRNSGARCTCTCFSIQARKWSVDTWFKFAAVNAAVAVRSVRSQFLTDSMWIVCCFFFNFVKTVDAIQRVNHRCASRKTYSPHVIDKFKKWSFNYNEDGIERKNGDVCIQYKFFAGWGPFLFFNFSFTGSRSTLSGPSTDFVHLCCERTVEKSESS